MEELNSLLANAKTSSQILAQVSSDVKNLALLKIAITLKEHITPILTANQIDIQNAIKNNVSKAMLDRLELTDKKIIAIANDCLKVRDLADPIGEEIDKIVRPNGLIIHKVRVPIGVIGIIYESRPNVSVDIATLCIKTGNACILKGGSDAINTNRVLVNLMKDAINGIIPQNAITFIDSTDRNVVSELITKREYIDLIVPRGSKQLIDWVVNNATVPVIETGAGNCHLYIDKDADINKALAIAINGKVSRPSVCNAIEKILVHEDVASTVLPLFKNELRKYNVEIRGCIKTSEIIKCNIATEDDYYTEYNDYIVAIKIVNDVKKAINHINHYGTKHSDVIITENKQTAESFLNEVDSACVYHNASSRFSDGGEFGFGAELGISTQKLHARGPMGLKEMTSYKYKIYGSGQIR